MKIIIRENQIEKLYPLLKKYWDKKPHPLFDDKLRNLLGNNFPDEYFISMFIDYLGADEIEERCDKLFSKYSTCTHIVDCGTYDFNFVLKIFDIDFNEQMVEVYANCDLEGTVDIDGEEMTIGEAMFNEDYGWEVEMEIKDCINNTIWSDFKRETGLDTHIQFI